MRRRDWFSPGRVAAILLGVRTVPYLVSASFDLSKGVHPLVLNRPTIDNIENEIAYLGLLHTAGFIALLAGARSRGVPSFIARKIPLVAAHPTAGRLLLASLSAVLLGLVAFAYFLQAVGGLQYLLQNLAARTRITSGHGYLVASYRMAFVFATTTAIFLFRYSRRWWQYLLLGAIVSLSVGILTSTGGRSGTVELLFACTIIWHYCVRPIKRISPSAILAAAFVALYVVFVPVLRSPGGYEALLNRPSEVLAKVGDNMGLLARGNSYVDAQLLVIHHFNPDNVWLGRSYLDLAVAPVPRRLLPDKPPVDDGVYLYTIATGREVVPPRPFSELQRTSWPPYTFGISFMNFWIPGMLFGMFVLGICYSSAYLYMERAGYSLFSVFAYAAVMWRFQLSNLQMVATGTNVVLIGLLCTMFFSVGSRRWRTGGRRAASG